MRHTAEQLDALSLAVWRLVRSFEDFRLSSATHLDIGPTEMIALATLAVEGPLTPSALAERLSLTSGSVTALLRRLTASGYIASAPNPEDGRSIIVTMRPSGRYAMQWVGDQLTEAVQAALDTEQDTEPELLTRFAETLSARLSATSRPSAGEDEQDHEDDEDHEDEKREADGA